MEPTLPTLTLLYNPSRLGDVLDALEDLHTAASEGTLSEAATVSRAELIGWLHEVLFLASQTIDELEAGSAAAAGDVPLTLVRKSS